MLRYSRGSDCLINYILRTFFFFLKIVTGRGERLIWNFFYESGGCRELTQYVCCLIVRILYLVRPACFFFVFFNSVNMIRESIGRQLDFAFRMLLIDKEKMNQKKNKNEQEKKELKKKNATVIVLVC